MKNLKINIENVEKLKNELIKMRDEKIKNGLKIQGNSNIVKGLEGLDMLEFYDNNFNNLMTDYKAAGGINRMVEGGCFLIYNDDIKNHLNNYLGLNPKGKEFSNEKSFDLYKHLCCTAFDWLRYEKINNKHNIFIKE